MNRLGFRRGASLVELLAVIAATTVVLGVGSGLLHRTLSLQAASRGHLEHDRTALVLGRQVRADIHAARAVDVTPAGPRVVRIEPAGGGRIDWESSPRGLRRVATDGAGRGHREDYRFPAGTTWEADRDGALVRLRGTGTAGPRTGPAYDVEILARLPMAAEVRP